MSGELAEHQVTDPLIRLCVQVPNFSKTCIHQRLATLHHYKLTRSNYEARSGLLNEPHGSREARYTFRAIAITGTSVDGENQLSQRGWARS